MRKKSQKILDVLSFLGGAFIITFGALAVQYAYEENGMPGIFYAFPYLTLILGILCFVFTLISTKKAYHMFISILLTFFGCVSVADMIFHFGTVLNQWWPVFGMVTGVAWFASGMYKYKRFSLGYAIPSLVLFVLGCWFMLFSFKIIKVPFTKVVVMLGPVYVIVLMLIMVGLYFLQKRNKKLIIENEEPGVFADEELVLTDVESETTGE